VAVTPIIIRSVNKSEEAKIAVFENYFLYSRNKYSQVQLLNLNGQRGYRTEIRHQKQALLLLIAKVVSLMTVIVPIIMAVGLWSVRKKKETLRVESPAPQVSAKILQNTAEHPLNQIPHEATSLLLLPGTNLKRKENVYQIPDSMTLRKYTGDLTGSDKLDIQSQILNEDTLQIAFAKFPDVHFTIRRQNIFNSGAQIIVNAANQHLGGGGGIDGAIHKAGGTNYVNAHRELQKIYKSQYVSGYAAMIESGDLKNHYQIDAVIVVAGPQGDSNAQKEDELYSCYYNSLVLAQSLNQTSIAFPSISTGIFGFPKERAAAISVKAVMDFLMNYPRTSTKTLSIHFLPTEPIQNLEIYHRSVSK